MCGGAKRRIMSADMGAKRWGGAAPLRPLLPAPDPACARVAQRKELPFGRTFQRGRRQPGATAPCGWHLRGGGVGGNSSPRRPMTSPTLHRPPGSLLAAAPATLSRNAKNSPSGSLDGAAPEGPAAPRLAAVALGRGTARVPALPSPASPVSAAEAFLRRLHLRDATFSPSRRSGSLETTPGAALRAGAFLLSTGPGRS